MTAPTSIPGDPDTIEETAASLERAAAALVDTRDDVVGHRRVLADGWQGDAATTAVASLEHPALAIAAAAERLRLVAPVLRGYADELRAAQLQNTQVAADHALLANQTAAQQLETGAVPITAQGAGSGAAPTGGSGFAGVTAEVGNALASVGNAALHDPLAVVGVVGGVAVTTVSVAGFAGGLVADATVVGAVVGVPAGVVSAAGVVTGVGLVGAGAHDLAQHAITDDRVTPFQVNAQVEDPGPGAPAAERIPRVGEAGENRQVRELPDDQAVRDLFEELSEGGAPSPRPGYDGEGVTAPDGTWIGLRENSRSGGPTIDAKLPNSTGQWKVHVAR